MELIFDSYVLNLPVWLVLTLVVLTAFLITYISIPTIITVSHKLNLYETVNGRESHKGEIPTLGGVAIFASLVITGAVFSNHDENHELQYILGSLVILFFIGVKDDLLIMDPKKKLIGQVLAAGIIIVLGDVRITTFHGFANINEVSYLVSVVFSLLVFLVIINGFNLIDGIDGLSSGIGIITSLTFASWFISIRQYEFALVPIGLAASLVAFFRFNVFSKKNKIFLGDTGSLCIGLIMAVIAIKFLEFQDPVSGEHTMLAAPAVAFGVLIVPIFDTLRVFILRVFEGDSPFKGDKKHIHHRLLDLGCTHLGATSRIILVNIIIIGVVFLLRNIGNFKLLMIVFFLAALFSYIPVYLIMKRRAKEKEDI